MDNTNLRSTLQTSSNALRRKWISEVKSEIEKSPLSSYVVFSLVLAGLEKLVEVEFACPCNPRWNALFAAIFFILPPVIACVLIYISREKKKDTVFFSFVQAMVWQILMFLDGQYFACAKTNWSGRFVIIDKAAPLKWCEPTNRNSSQDLMIKTQRWFFDSQVVGIGLVFAGLTLFAVYKTIIICKCCTTEEQVQEENSSICQQDQNQDSSAI
ncbi:uncharacterized protein LOC120793729 [Xiphias gladius]|uniref:uncharacterized protein LOC120793729 n=1 Tax=Xiphias gladius TaxID=8245 RepID=UPI001A984041|nr:uncharacterized protein LOC120793729 [Xiphias gladius]